MNKLSIILTTIILLQHLISSLDAQTARTDQIPADKTPVIGAQQLDEMVSTIGELVSSKYIHAEMGKKMSDRIHANHRKRKYQGMTFQQFGRQLRKDFVDVSGDVHMNAFYEQPNPSQQPEAHEFKVDDWGKPSNYGFVEFKISKDNIGYLKIGHFGKQKFFEEQKRTATRCIEMLENTNAIIIDVRGNPGGYEEIVAFVMSYFFDRGEFQLQEYYCRYSDRSRDIKITDVPGKCCPDVPMYILIDRGTGSAAESLAYMMKHLKRATVIGEKSVGAGNGSNYFNVTDQFKLQIATWETINAITKTSWEKVGVIPNIETTSEQAIVKAYELADAAGTKYRNRVNQQSFALLKKLTRAVENHPLATNDTELQTALSECLDHELHNQSTINELGYELLREEKHLKTAEVVFRANVQRYPESANVYDSLGEALIANGKPQEAVAAYEKAVLIGKEAGDPNLYLYIENLARLKKQLK